MEEESGNPVPRRLCQATTVIPSSPLQGALLRRRLIEGSENPVPTLRRAIESRLPSRRRIRRRSPLWVIASRLRIERVGLDLICNSCRLHISKSQKLMFSCHFYRSDPNYDLWGCPLTRCFVRCPNPNCNRGLRLGRNLGDSDSFKVISGATQHFPPEESDNEFDGVYPDTLLDSPNDTDGNAVEEQSLACGVRALAAAFHVMEHQKGRFRSMPMLNY